MMLSSSLRLAFRNLGRNPRRTALSIVGVGVGCAIALTLYGFRHSVTEVYTELAAEAGPGHFRVSPQAWLPERDEKLRLAEGESVLLAVRKLDGVLAAAPRVRVQALLAMGTQVASVELVGVDPLAEPLAYRAVRKVVAGRYLKPTDTDAVVIGKTIAERLRVELDDELLLTVMGPGGQLENAMIRIVGVVTSGSRELDAQVAQVPLALAQRLSGRPGIAEVAVMLKEPQQVEKIRPQLTALSGPNTVLGWAEVSAELSGHLKQDEAAANLMSSIVIFVVLLGVAAAQLTAVLERKREFAVFAAIGMRPFKLAFQIVLESFVLGILGALAGALLAAPGLWYLSVKGIDLSSFITSETTFEGVMMDPVFHAKLGWWMVPYLLRLAFAATLLGAIYPAVYAARTNPATALRAAP